MEWKIANIQLYSDSVMSVDQIITWIKMENVSRVGAMN